MESKATIISTLESTFSELDKAIKRFDENTFNQRPAKGGWTPAQVAQHLALAGTGIDNVLLGETRATEGTPDKQVASIKEVFLNFDLKMTSPDFIEPADEVYDQKALLAQLKNVGDTLVTLVKDLDLSPTCLAFEVPVWGYMTRLEIIYFVIYHTQRHTRQLQQISF